MTGFQLVNYSNDVNSIIQVKNLSLYYQALENSRGFNNEAKVGILCNKA